MLFTIVHLLAMHSCTVVYIRVHVNLSGYALCILVKSPIIWLSIRADVIIYGVIFSIKCYVMLTSSTFIWLYEIVCYLNHLQLISVVFVDMEKLGLIVSFMGHVSTQVYFKTTQHRVCSLCSCCGNRYWQVQLNHCGYLVKHLSHYIT